MDKSKKLSNEELMNVSGGSCYSRDTFSDLGVITYDPIMDAGEHPLITTSNNSCRLHDYKGDQLFARRCSNCRYDQKEGAITSYCGRRSRETDHGK